MLARSKFCVETMFAQIRHCHRTVFLFFFILKEKISCFVYNSNLYEKSYKKNTVTDSNSCDRN